MISSIVNISDKWYIPLVVYDEHPIRNDPRGYDIMSIITLGDGRRELQFPLLGAASPDKIHSLAQELSQVPNVGSIRVSTELTIHVIPQYGNLRDDARRALAQEVHEGLKERLAAGLIVV